jgi:hypothetical protein
MTLQTGTHVGLDGRRDLDAAGMRIEGPRFHLEERIP